MKKIAKIFIKNELLGKYLFHLRDNKPDILYPNCFGLLGGAIEKNETPLEAIKRELQEESDIHVFDIEALGSIVLHESGHTDDGNELHIFRATTHADPHTTRLYEGQTLSAFTITEALALENLAPPIREALLQYRLKLL